MRKIFTFLMTGLLSVSVFAQTHIFPAEDTVNNFTAQNSFAQINTTLYVGNSPYLTPQLAATAACLISGNILVDIPIGFSSSVTVPSLTGCSTAYFKDERTIPFTYYQYTGGAYVSIPVGITQLSGDVTSNAGNGNISTTLATVNTGPGLCGDSTHTCQVTTNGKGLVTSQTAVSINAASTPVTTNLLKGTGSLNGVVAAVPGTDYISSVTYGLSQTSGVAQLTNFAANQSAAPIIDPRTFGAKFDAVQHIGNCVINTAALASNVATLNVTCNSVSQVPHASATNDTNTVTVQISTPIISYAGIGDPPIIPTAAAYDWTVFNVTEAPIVTASFSGLTGTITYNIPYSTPAGYAISTTSLSGTAVTAYWTGTDDSTDMQNAANALGSFTNTPTQTLLNGTIVNAPQGTMSLPSGLYSRITVPIQFPYGSTLRGNGGGIYDASGLGVVKFVTNSSQPSYARFWDQIHDFNVFGPGPYVSTAPCILLTFVNSGDFSNIAADGCRQSIEEVQVQASHFRHIVPTGSREGVYRTGLVSAPQLPTTDNTYFDIQARQNIKYGEWDQDASGETYEKEYNNWNGELWLKTGGQEPRYISKLFVTNIGSASKCTASSYIPLTFTDSTVVAPTITLTTNVSGQIISGSSTGGSGFAHSTNLPLIIPPGPNNAQGDVAQGYIAINSSGVPGAITITYGGLSGSYAASTTVSGTTIPGSTGVRAVGYGVTDASGHMPVAFMLDGGQWWNNPTVAVATTGSTTPPYGNCGGSGTIPAVTALVTDDWQEGDWYGHQANITGKSSRKMFKGEGEGGYAGDPSQRPNTGFAIQLGDSTDSTQWSNSFDSPIITRDLVGAAFFQMLRSGQGFFNRVTYPDLAALLPGTASISGSQCLVDSTNNDSIEVYWGQGADSLGVGGQTSALICHNGSPYFNGGTSWSAPSSTGGFGYVSQGWTAVGPAAGSIGYNSRVYSGGALDAYDRFECTLAGTCGWGTGAATQDTFLGRANAYELSSSNHSELQIAIQPTGYSGMNLGYGGINAVRISYGTYNHDCIDMRNWGGTGTTPSTSQFANGLFCSSVGPGTNTIVSEFEAFTSVAGSETYKLISEKYGTQSISFTAGTASATGGSGTEGWFTSSTTGTTTFVMTLPLPSSVGFKCSATDITTGVAFTQTGSLSTTTCTLTGTTVSGNTVIWNLDAVITN